MTAEPARGYLDTPSMGLPVPATVDAMTEALHTWAAGRAHYSVWETSMEACRGLFAEIAGVPASEVGLLSSIVPAISAAASTLARGSGVVVAHRREYRSLLLPVLAQLGEQRIRWVDGPYVARTFLDALDESADGVLVSAVSSHDGGRPSLGRLQQACDAVGAGLVVDGTQAMGTVVPDVDMRALAMFACAGYKGLRNPRGTAYAVARHDVAEAFHAPSPYGVADAAERSTYGPPLVPKAGAPGLDQSPAWLAWVGAEPALVELAKESPEDRERRVVALSERLRTELRQRGVEPQDTDLPSPIVTFATTDPRATVRRLQECGVRATVKVDRVRVGFHVYNDEGDVDLVCQAEDR